MTKFLFISLFNFGSYLPARANFMATTKGPTTEYPKGPYEGIIEVQRKALENLGYKKSTRQWFVKGMRVAVSEMQTILVNLDNGNCKSVHAVLKTQLDTVIEMLFGDGSPLKPILDLVPTGGDPMMQTVMTTLLALGKNSLKDKAAQLLEECGPEDLSETKEDDKILVASGMQGVSTLAKKGLARLNFDEERTNAIVQSANDIATYFQEFDRHMADGNCQQIKLALDQLGHSGIHKLQENVQVLIKDIEALQTMTPILFPVLEQQFTNQLKQRINDYPCTEKSATEEVEDDDDDLAHVEG